MQVAVDNPTHAASSGRSCYLCHPPSSPGYERCCVPPFLPSPLHASRMSIVGSWPFVRTPHLGRSIFKRQNTNDRRKRLPEFLTRTWYLVQYIPVFSAQASTAQGCSRAILPLGSHPHESDGVWEPSFWCSCTPVSCSEDGLQSLFF
jgi:hypothetical protein